MARRARRRQLSKKMAGGIAFIATSLIGGFVSSVGTDVYHSIKDVFSIGLPLSFPQIVFLIIGIAGLGLMLSAVLDVNRSKPRARKRS